ncbi:MAG: hypothetical protein IIY21_02170 [Clostridiales bacterium]|nr:hypothetical protein [Clostridiales bacterium]
MYVSIKDLAVREGCSVSQVYRNVREMESSSLYPQGVKESGGLKINVDNYDDFLCRRRRKKVGREE